MYRHVCACVCVTACVRAYMCTCVRARTPAGVAACVFVKALRV